MTRTMADDDRDFIAKLPDGDYLIEPSRPDAYGIRKDATFITVRDGKLIHRYQDLWCGGEAPEGETFRQHRDGRRAPYPKRLRKAKSIIRQWAKLDEDYPQGFDTDWALAQLLP